MNLLRAASVALLLFELSLLAVRFSLTPSKIELLWFASVLILVACRGFLPDTVAVVGLFNLLVLWSLGMYSRYLSAQSGAWAWHGGIGAVGSIFLFVRAIGLGSTVPFHLLYAFLLSLLSLYPLYLLSGLCRANRHPLLFAYTICCAAALASSVYDYLSCAAVLPELSLYLYSGLLYLVICGLLLSQEAYLLGSGWQGLHIRLGEQQKRLLRAHSRLIQTENTVMLQDRLIITGILAAGAAHEFKNTLSLVQATAGFAARSQRMNDIRQALELIAEQARSGQKVVTELLDQILERGREEVATVHLRSDLDLLLRMIRTGCRREGIHLTIEIPQSVSVAARPGELEQILLNLVRNAMDSVRAQSGSSERKVRIIARRDDGQVIIEVVDSGPGVPPGLKNRIFEPSVSGKQSSGLGLFLAKALVERNHGTLSCIPGKQGGCFRILLPSAGD
ncbi:MAG: HAMP domain-containing histidine kinase [Spirochaetales bacterium]|nr:HAMP domain-containing histidine kinase [Spirochaetales bacterium]